MILYYLSLFLAWLLGMGICAILVFYSYQAYLLVDHFDRLEDQCEREARKAFGKLFELEVLKTRIDLLTNR
jgi:hypothetical protein